MNLVSQEVQFKN